MIGINERGGTAKREAETSCLAMRPREAAKALGISERLLWDWTNRGDIPHVRLGKVVLYPRDVLRRWLSERAITEEEVARDPG